MAGKTVLVLGGGVGGIVTANSLRRRLGPEHRVVLVDRRGEYLFAPSLLWVMVGQRRPDQITKDLRRMVRPGVEVLQAEAQEIDPARSRVRAGEQELAYDYLVVALGADLAPDALPGYTEAAHNFFALEGAVKSWQALTRFAGGRALVLVSSLPYKCPAAPYEAAMLVDDALRRRGVRGRSQVAVYSPEAQPMPVAGPAMGDAVTQMLAAKDILFHTGRQVQSIDAERRELVFTDGNREPFDFLAAVPPHRAPAMLRSSGLTNEAGWILVDKHSLKTRYDNVYAIGDATAITLANGKPLPKAGTFAHAQAEVVAGQIAAEVRGESLEAEFDGAGYCWLEAGGGSAGFTSGQFYAEPNPIVPLPRAGRLWHLGKVMFERYWLDEGVTRQAMRLGLNAGAKVFGISARV
jgi:sulfide:quinone oxidoreductase